MSVRLVAAADTFCTIMSTLALAFATILKICAALPGTSGTPTTVIFASLRSVATPEMIGSSTIPSFFAASAAAASLRTYVPTRFENEERTCRVTLWRRAYSTARMCRTLAPAAASSSISSLVMRSILRASGTWRGSEVNTPSTSV